MNTLDPTSHPALASHVRLMIDPVNGDPVLLYPEGLLVLNATAYEIARRCDGATSIADLVRQLADEFEAEEETLRGDVMETLDRLRQQNLLVFPT